jgi:Uma2 family endonuclease
MTARPKTKMTVDKFLAWAEHRPGRYELVNGEVFAMSPECARHARTKAAVHLTLVRAIRHAGLPCEALPDGMTVRIDARTAYEPDALAYCGERLPGDAVEVPNSMIVAEVASPGTKGEDTGGKLAGYFAVPSVEHYLVVEPVLRSAIHHRRAGDIIQTRIASGGPLHLDPSGLELSVDDLFAEP